VKRELIQRNIHLLSQLLKNIIADRYKRMAKDEMLSRFISSRIDPVLLVDLSLQIERDSIELTEMSLLELVTPDRMAAEVKRSADRIQRVFAEIYGEEILENFLSEPLMDLRMQTIRSRIDFYNPFLTVEHEVESFFDLAAKAYVRAERFQKKMGNVVESDRQYNDELVRETNQLHRFMMRKQLDYEILKSEEIWLEFKTEAFKTPHALP